MGGNAGDSWSVDLGQTTASYALGAYAINFKSPTVIAASGKRPQYRALGVGGNVDVGLGRLYVHYMDSDADATTATGVSAVNKIWVLGWRVPVGKTSVKVAWTHDKARGLNGVAGRNGTKDTLALSAEYALSKRTSLHAAVFRNAYQDGYKLDPVNIAALSRDPNASSLQLYSVGVRHDF